MIARLLIGALCVLCSFVACDGFAQSAWPARTMRIVVPYAPGAFTDVGARALAQELSEQFGHPVVVENRGGAGSTLGTDVVAKAQADGYTLLMVDNAIAVSSGLYAKLPYDPLKDFVHVSLIAEAPAILIARLDLPAKNLRELVELARAQPGTLTYGSGGQGSSAHLGTEFLLSGPGVKMQHVPFKGVAIAISEVVAGRIDLALSSMGTPLSYVRGGRVRALGITGKERSALLPDVPTFAEAGFPEFNMTYWFGVAVPAGTPPEIVSRLRQEMIRAADKPRLKEVYASLGARPVTSAPGEFARRIAEETRLWKAVIDKAGVKPE
jgi:tripartite-type tricarboxylate transporter receptor subunit TctC